MPNIIDILIKDSKLLREWFKFSDLLKSHQADKERWGTTLRNGTVGYYECFSEILGSWVSKNPRVTVYDLCQILIQMNNVAVAEKLECNFSKDELIYYIMDQQTDDAGLSPTSPNLQYNAQSISKELRVPKTNFYGRLKILDTLSSYLPSQDENLILIYGFGGVGKTDMFRKFAYDLDCAQQYAAHIEKQKEANIKANTDLTHCQKEYPAEKLKNLDIANDSPTSSSVAQPLQIMNFEDSEDPSKPRLLKLYKENLQSIVDQAGDRRVAIISIAGPSRQGKSFLLGFMIRYLEALQNDESDWMNWKNKSKPLTGFKWRSGIEHEPSGMLMWSKPFIVKVDNDNNDIAVLLIDTQGTNEEYSTVREMSAVVGLSLLTSSCLIFNFLSNLQEDIFNSLETYIHYGLMASQTQDKNCMETESQGHPFQKLLFLIRDWGFPDQFPFGSEGGRAFLKTKLEIKDRHPEATKKIRVTIKECFDQLDCFLMPSPGDKATLNSFTGCLAQLNPMFAERLEEFINDHLDPDKLPLKSIFGNEVMTSDVMSYFEQYVEVFNCEDVPAPTTLIEATSKIANLNLINKCRLKYVESMKKKLRGKKFLSNKMLQKMHTTASDDVLREYKKARKMGSPEMINLFVGQLSLDIKEKFDRISYENETKKTKLVQEAMIEAIKQYKETMADEFQHDDSFVEETNLKSQSEASKTDGIAELKENLGNEDEELEKIEEDFIRRLEDEESRILTENKNRKMNAEKKLNELVKIISVFYKDEMTSNLESNPFMTDEELKESNKSTRQESVQMFNKEKKGGPNAFVKTYLESLELVLDKAFNEMQKSHQLNVLQIERKAKTLLNEAIKDYEEYMETGIDEISDEAELESKHMSKLQEIEIDFQTKCPYPEGSHLKEKMLQTLQEKLDSSNQSILKEFLQSKKDCEESYIKAVEDGYQLFCQKMTEFVDKTFHSDDDLQTEHENWKIEAMTTYSEYPKIGLHSNPEQFLENLSSKIKTEFEKIKNSNVQKKDLAEANAKIDLTTCHGDYQSEMMKNLDTARDEDQFEDFHKQLKEDAIKKLQRLCSIKDPAFLEPFVEKLETEIDASYSVELIEVFKLKMSERDGATNSALGDARKFYREEMAKHFINTEFMRPKDLHDLHKKVAATAIEKCAQNTPLSQMQKEDLGAELEKTYISYKEENDANLPIDPAIGIDLGTTYSCVAVYLKGKVTVIPNAQRKTITPSYICYNDKGYVESIGDPAKSKAYENAETTIYDAKRIIGRKIDDLKLQNDMKYWAFKVVADGQVPKVEVNGKKYFPEQISSEILKEMRAVAEKHLNCHIKNAVITVPAYFNDGQRQATIDAGKLAGLNVLKILNEPTSAAVAYKLQYSDDGFRHVLVFDLGGGTFDVAVLKLTKGKIETLAVDGDTHLGGEDFDQNTMKYCALEFQRLYGVDLLDGKDSDNVNIKQDARKRIMRLQLECERRKIDLASCRTVDVCVDGIWNEGGTSTHLNVTLTRDKFEELNEEFFEKAIKIVERVLESASLDKSRIDDIVLVGGSTKIPKVQAMLSDFFNGKALNRTINPDEAVAYGAAIQAAILNGQIAQESTDYNKIQDVTPMSLGIKLYSGGFSIIIPKSSKFPVKIEKQYRTAYDNHTSVQIKIYQGEDSVAQSNSWLGEFYLNGIPPAEAGRETIDVTMEINLQGILHVTAVCTSTGETNSITVNEHKLRMGKDDFKRILAEAKPGAA